MKIYKNGLLRETTDDDLQRVQEMEEADAQRAAAEKKRPLTATECMEMLLRQQIQTLEVDDQTALRMLDFYPTFEESIGKTVQEGYKFVYNGLLYKTRQPTLLMQAHYAPGEGMESLYTRIDEEHAGDRYDPIPYSGNMELEAGLYYTQDSVTYHCTTGTGQPVYRALAELVGIYVEVVPMG